MTFLGVLSLWDYRLRGGGLTNYLLRPVNVIHRDLALMLANKVITLTFIFLGILILGVLFHPTFSLTVSRFSGILVALAVAFLMRFVLETVVGMSAFWIIRVDALERLYVVILFFCSGRIAPLALLPDWMQAIANVLPFRWILAFPAELLLGRLSQTTIIQGFLAQGLWLAFLLICLPLIWHIGVKRYTGVDG
jgi:ABC-2 type transport system permease protein